MRVNVQRRQLQFVLRQRCHLEVQDKSHVVVFVVLFALFFRCFKSKRLHFIFCQTNEVLENLMNKLKSEIKSVITNSLGLHDQLQLQEVWIQPHKKILEKNLNGKKEIISYFNFAEIIIFVRLDGFLGSFF